MQFSIVYIIKLSNEDKLLIFLCSGQSGSGKTEAAKMIVHYISCMYQGRNNNLRQVNICGKCKETKKEKV